jgi:hypothetical protein
MHRVEEELAKICHRINRGVMEKLHRSKQFGEGSPLSETFEWWKNNA